MLFIAMVEATLQFQGAHIVRIGGVVFDVNTRPRPPLGAWLAIVLPGLTAPVRPALEEWRAQHCPAGELAPRYFRRAVLGDLMDAVNAEAQLALARTASADELAAFATGHGGALLAEVRAKIAAGDIDAVPALAARVARFAAICGIVSARETLVELATMHPVEQLMAFEHAVAQWLQATAEPVADELAALARELPSEDASAGVSRAWFRWWWRLAYRTPRADLRVAVIAAVARARLAYRDEPVTDAIADAEAAIDRMRIADATRLWSEPPDSQYEFPPPRDDDDAHYCAYLAVTHAAHALAAALRDKRAAMKLLAQCALDALLVRE